MGKSLISLMFVLLFVVGSCGGEDTSGAGDCSNSFPNYHKGFCWSDVSADVLTWDAAFAFCENLGGRLPTISELRTLVQNCAFVQDGGACGVTDDCLSVDDCWNDACKGCSDSDIAYNVFGDTGTFWSSSCFVSKGETFAWRINFESVNVYGSNIMSSAEMHARCVK